MGRLDDEYIRRIASVVVLALLLVLSFLILKPILISILTGIILAFIFNPIYNFLLKYTRSKNLSAFLIVFLLLLVIVIPIWFLTPIFIQQSFNLFFASQELDIASAVQAIQDRFPTFFVTEAFSQDLANVIKTFITRTTNTVTNSLSSLILNLPQLLLQLFVAIFALFYVLRDRDVIIAYVKSILPFSRDVEKKLFEYSRSITTSVIYGQVIVGIIQGVIIGIGFLVFNVPNALFLSLVSILLGILPIVGTIIVWVPVVFYLLATDNQVQAIGVTLFGLVSSSVDNFLRAIIVSQRTRLNTSIILAGMIGGFFLLGVIGLILGPLILAYLLVILELYRKKESPEIFVQDPNKTS